MSAPARHRDVYVIGRMGSYELPTLPSCERLITQMTALLRSSVCADDRLHARVVWDRDLVIEQWSRLAFEKHAGEALDQAGPSL